jgi:protein gp37
MGSMSSIEWTEATWNPTVGCTKVSPGCKHCYAEVMHGRLQAMPSARKYADSFRVVQAWPDDLELPLSWKKPKTIFVNSMSDLFHEAVPEAYIRRCMDVMCRAHWHTFQVLTKRSERLRALGTSIAWPRNVWMGVSVENVDFAHRASHLSSVPAAVRFLSVEPLIGPIDDLPLEGIDWVIVGGESGTRARPMSIEWARGIRDQCASHDVAFFLKQLGGRRSKRGGDDALLDGRLWREYPRQAAPAHWRMTTWCQQNGTNIDARPVQFFDRDVANGNFNAVFAKQFEVQDNESVECAVSSFVGVSNLGSATTGRIDVGKLGPNGTGGQMVSGNAGASYAVTWVASVLP